MPANYTTPPSELYGVDFQRSIWEVLPWFFRYDPNTYAKREALEAFVNCLVGSLQPANNTLVQLVTYIRDRLAYTGQVLSLETLLNDKYDPDLRRISIRCLNANYIEGLDLYTNPETDPTPSVLFSNPENNQGLSITLFTNAERVDPDSLFGKSFIVDIPAAVPGIDTALVRALLDGYVPAPQNYLIERT